MKKIKKKKPGKNKIKINVSPMMKISEMIVAYASDYINLGDTTEERQNYLNGACTAWNIANLPEHLRDEALHQLAEQFKKMNPRTESTEDYLKDIRMLIQKKLQMFPDVRKSILNAYVVPINNDHYSVNVVSSHDL